MNATSCNHLQHLWWAKRLSPLSFAALLALVAVIRPDVEGAQAGASVVHGVVQNAEGDPLPNLQVLLFDYDAGRFDPALALAGADTGSDGQFSLTTSHAGPGLLKIVGEEGAGRLKVAWAGESDPLTITYPVRTTIVFLHDNDTHFNLNRLDSFKETVARYRREHTNVFLVSAGDIFIRHPGRWPDPGPEYYAERSRWMIETMNDLGYDVLAPGNHELDYIDELTRQSLELARFPLIAANIEVATDKLPPLQSHLVLETDNRHTIAVLGLSTVNFKKEGVRALDPVETARKYIHLAREHDVIMALTHIGLRNDQRLAEKVEGFDLIVGGHSHSLLLQAIEVNGVLIAQAGGVPPGHPVSRLLPKFLGVVTVVLENGGVVEKRGHVLIFK